jgi:methylated-DNA-[protein]-cysteine S-methyltransferase
MTTTETYLESPVGTLHLAAGEAGLTHLLFARESSRALPRSGAPGSPLLREALAQLEAYFAGERREFDLPLAPEGTPFQLATWQALREIPYGTTLSYGELARRIGKPRAVRAVGAANSRNPISIIVPCHRVIGSDGTLTGYGGGLEVKRRLLELEGVRLDHQGGTPSLFGDPDHE